MQPLTPKSLKDSFVNTSKREAAEAIPPFKLDEVEWEKIDVFGWTDKSNPMVAYAVIPVEGTPVGIMLRASATKPKKTMCALCEDIIDLSDVRLFVAKRAGAAGRKGDTIGTLIHAGFTCNKNVRRKPNRFEGVSDPEGFVAKRVTALQEHAVQFALRVLNGEELQ